MAYLTKYLLKITKDFVEWIKLLFWVYKKVSNQLLSHHLIHNNWKRLPVFKKKSEREGESFSFGELKTGMYSLCEGISCACYTLS